MYRVFSASRAGTPFAWYSFMASGSRSRGSTCVDIAIMLGVIGALVIFVTAAGFRKFEIAEGMHHGGPMCR